MAAIAWPLKEQRSIPHEKKLSFLLVFTLWIWISLIFLLSKNQTWRFMIHFFEIVSTLLLAFYISYLLMTNCSEFGKCSTVKKSADHLMPDCLQKAFDFNVFRDIHHLIGRLNLVVLLFIIPGSCAFAINNLSKNLIKWYLWQMIHVKYIICFFYYAVA